MKACQQHLQAALARLGALSQASSQERETFSPPDLPWISGEGKKGEDGGDSSWGISGIGHDDTTTEAKEEEMMRLGCLD